MSDEKRTANDLAGQLRRVARAPADDDGARERRSPRYGTNETVEDSDDVIVPS